jgi:hypothetical protein
VLLLYGALLLSTWIEPAIASFAEAQCTLPQEPCIWLRVEEKRSVCSSLQNNAVSAEDSHGPANAASGCGARQLACLHTGFAV